MALLLFSLAQLLSYFSLVCIILYSVLYAPHPFTHTLIRYFTCASPSTTYITTTHYLLSPSVIAIPFVPNCQTQSLYIHVLISPLTPEWGHLIQTTAEQLITSIIVSHDQHQKLYDIATEYNILKYKRNPILEKRTKVLDYPHKLKSDMWPFVKKSISQFPKLKA